MANVHADGSFSNRSRTRRFAAFEQLVDPLLHDPSRPVRILDIGGRSSFWEQRGWAERDDVQIVIVNLAEELVAEEGDGPTHPSIELRVGDATDLSAYPDGAFDVVFSNSVIEHLATYEHQSAMAREVERLAPICWVQTPNFWFPVEPHFLTPAWHWLPERHRVALLQRRRWGWCGPCPDIDEARLRVREVRLMRGSELRRLFPDAKLQRERIGPLVKSFVAVREPSETR
ncbi:MAG: class I SAM-dependent methyltransferase [Solirubrobacteraceae bacterium]